MTVEILGRREDQCLEFKSKDSLGRPDALARAVVGMLNAGGGEIWIGVEETEEEGRAASIDPVPEPERAKGRLLDSLLDRVDPSPTADEVVIGTTPADADPALLVIAVHPADEQSGRWPYALRQGGAWHFIRRVGARNHPMSREEIFGATVRRSEDQGLEGAIRTLELERRAFRDDGGTGLWLALRPARTIRLDPQDDLLERITLDPSLTGNRRTGWHFARSSRQPKPTKDGVEWGLWFEIGEEYLMRVQVTERGEAWFHTALDLLLHGRGEEREIWPLTLLEYPISAFRIARVIYENLLVPEDRVAADLALFGVKDWGLREGSPGEFSFGDDLVRLDDPDLLWEPVVFRFREIDEHPDRCGFRLVRRVYQAFGIREEGIPRQYDRETGRLLLPE